MNKKSKKIFTLYLTLAMVLTMTVFSSAAFAATRYDGADRYETALEIARAGWEKADTAVIATGVSPADALSAAPLAKSFDAPLLLVESGAATTINNSKVIKSLKELGVNKVIIVGGNNEVTESLEKAIKEFAEIERIGGADRYETSVEVAIALAKRLGKSFVEVAVVNGSDESFADALSISPIAAYRGMPILLTRKNDIPKAVADYLKDLNLTKSYVIGETAVVSNAVLNSIKESVRLGGADRYATNRAVLSAFDDIKYEKVYVATGIQFADALSGSVLAAKTNSPIVLIGEKAEAATKDLLAGKKTDKVELLILGGEKAISEASVKDLEDSVVHALKVKSVSVIDSTTLEVVLSDGTTHKVTLGKALEANTETEVTFVIDGRTYSAKVTWYIGGGGGVTPTEPEEPIEADFVASNSFGIHDDKVYAGYELKDKEGKQIALVANNIEKMTVKNPDGTTGKLIIGDDEDPLLWFNVEKATGKYIYNVETKAGETYEATIDWKEPDVATWEATAREGEHDGKTYVEYKLMGGEGQISLAEGQVKLIAQKGAEDKWAKLEANTDETLWFNKAKPTGEYEFLVVTNGNEIYKATLEWLDEKTKEALAAVNSAEKYTALKAVIEGKAEILGLNLEKYNTLIAKRKPSVSLDLYDSKTEDGYTLESLKLAFDEIVETRLVFQESMDLVNAATAENPLSDISFVTMLINNLEKVTNYTKHSGKDIKEELIPSLQSLVNRYNALSEDKQVAALKEVSSKDYASSTQTRQALGAALKVQEDLVKAEAAIKALPLLEDIRIDHKPKVLEAKGLVDDAKKIDPDAEIEGEELLQPMLDKIDYLENELEDKNFSPSRMVTYPSDGTAMFNTSTVRIEGYAYNVKYLDKLLVDGQEAEIEYIKDAEIKNWIGNVVYKGPAYKFTKVLDLPDGVHTKKIKIISQSGRSFEDAYGTTVRVDTTRPELGVVVKDREATSDSAELEITMKDNFGRLGLYINGLKHKEYNDIDTPVDIKEVIPVKLESGENEFVIKLKDYAGNVTEKAVTITRK